MPKIDKANIEPIKWSIISDDVHFECGFPHLEKLMDFRRANLKTTEMYWITKQPVIDWCYNVYNPKALIFVILN